MANNRGLRAAWVCVAFLVALVLCNGFGYATVFQSDGVHFQEPDGYFHMRTVRNLMHHFPQRSGFDPYSGMPTGQPVFTGPFYDLAIGTVAWLAGAGSPSSGLTEIVGAWFPAVMGALLTVPVYVIGSALFGPESGIVAAFLVAIVPGTLLKVSRLGFTDHHVAESFLSALALMFLVLALRGKRPRLFSVLAGVSLGCFLATRPAGAFLIGFIALWAVLQCVWDRLRGYGNRTWLVFAPAVFVAWLVFAPVGTIVWSEFTPLALWGGLAAVALTGALAVLVRSRFAFVAIFIAVAAAGCGTLILWKPELLQSLLSNITSRQGEGPAATIAELRPLLILTGTLSWRPAWSEFTSLWFFALPALALLAWRCLRHDNPALNLFVALSAFMLLLSLAQNRNCYYLAVNMALLTSWACREILRRRKGYQRAVVTALLACVLLYPNISAAVDQVIGDNSPNADWTQALAWMRDNTPAPFGDPDAYDRYYPKLAQGAAFPYPAAAYGMMAWWDYGHWISAVARRIPVSNGMQTGAIDAARFFTTSNAEEAAQVLRRTRARYVIADATLIIPPMAALAPGFGKMLAMPTWIGGDARNFAEPYLTPSPEGGTKRVMVYYPLYYQSMLARLYLFEATAVEPGSSTWVIGYQEKLLPGGKRQRTMTSSTLFKTYEEAQRYFESIHGEPFVLAGLHPFEAACRSIRWRDIASRLTRNRES